MIENQFGKGAYTDLGGNSHYWIEADCKMHGSAND